METVRDHVSVFKILEHIATPVIVLQDKKLVFTNANFLQVFKPAEQQAIISTMTNTDEDSLVIALVNLPPIKPIFDQWKTDGQTYQVITLRTNISLEQEEYEVLVGFISDYTYSYTVDKAGKFTRNWITDKYLRITEHSPHDVDPIVSLDKFVHPDDITIAQEHLRTALTGQRDVAQFRYKHKSGQDRWLRSYLQPIWDEDLKRVVRLYGMGQDITSHQMAEEALLTGAARDIAFRQQAEAELRRYANELETINQELDAYGHTIAHDLKSPLSGVLGYMDLLDYSLDKDMDKARTYSQRIRGSVENMTKMISQLLWMARLRNAEETATRVEIQPLIDSVLERFQSTIEQRKIQVTVEPSLPAVMGHDPWIEEIFANLIGNALKYIGDENKTPTIHIRGFQQDAQIRFEVKDNGIGIKPEDQKKLFEEFTRVRQIKQDGFGLGLSIVNRIVRKSSGTLGVESKPGDGSMFWFTLPRAKE